MVSDPMNGCELRECKEGEGYKDHTPRPFDLGDKKYLIIKCPGCPGTDLLDTLAAALDKWDTGDWGTFSEKRAIQREILGASLDVVYASKPEKIPFSEDQWRDVYRYLVNGTIPGEA